MAYFDHLYTFPSQCFGIVKGVDALIDGESELLALYPWYKITKISITSWKYVTRQRVKLFRGLRARPQHCVTASHRKNQRRRTTHRVNFRYNLTSNNLPWDVGRFCETTPQCSVDRDVYDVQRSNWSIRNCESDLSLVKSR